MLLIHFQKEWHPVILRMEMMHCRSNNKFILTREQTTMSFRLGYYLVQQDKLTLEQVDRATRRQQLLGASLDTHLLELGWLDLETTTDALLQAFDSPTPAQEWLRRPSAQALECVPEEIVEQFQVLPIAQDAHGLHLITADLGPPAEHLPLSYWLNVPIKLYHVPQFRLAQALNRLYDRPIPKRFKALCARYSPKQLFEKTIMHSDSQNSLETSQLSLQLNKNKKAGSENTPKSLKEVEQTDTTSQKEKLTSQKSSLNNSLKPQNANSTPTMAKHPSKASTKYTDDNEHTDTQPSEEVEHSAKKQEQTSATGTDDEFQVKTSEAEKKIEQNKEQGKVEAEQKAETSASHSETSTSQPETSTSHSETSTSQPETNTSQPETNTSQPETNTSQSETQKTPGTSENSSFALEKGTDSLTKRPKRERPKRERRAKERNRRNKLNAPLRNQQTSNIGDAGKLDGQQDQIENSVSKISQSNLRPLAKKGTAGRPAVPLSLPSLARLRSAFRPQEEEETTAVSEIQTLQEDKSPDKQQTSIPPQMVKEELSSPPKTSSTKPSTLDFPDTQPRGAERSAPSEEAVHSLSQTMVDSSSDELIQAVPSSEHVNAQISNPPSAQPHIQNKQAELPISVGSASKIQVTEPFIQSVQMTQPVANTPIATPENSQSHSLVLTPNPAQAKGQQTPPPSNVATPSSQQLPSQTPSEKIPIMAGAFHEAMTIPGLPAFPPLSANPAQMTLVSGSPNSPIDTLNEEELSARIQHISNTPNTPLPEINDARPLLRDFLEATTPQRQQELQNQLIPLGGTLIPLLLESIPATEQIVEKNPGLKDHIKRIVELCVQVGDPAVYRLLQIIEKDPQDQRMKALFLLGEWLPSRAIAPLLQRLFSEKDPIIQKMIRNNLRGYRKRSEFLKLLQFLRDNLRSNDSHRLQKAIFFLSDLRIAEAVPDLVSLLEHESQTVRENTLFALRNLALQDYGNHIDSWKQWLQKNAQFDRRHWVVEALNHEEKAIRHLAKEELIVEFGDDFGYNPKASTAEREAVQKLAGLWLQKG